MANSLTKIKTNALADDAVTGAKIADDTVAEANMANDAIGLAEIKAGTDGQILTFDASGNPSYVGPGSDGQVLTSTGAGSPPAFEDAASGVGGATGVDFNDDVYIRLGTSNDLKIWHNAGANSYIRNESGNLVIQSNSAGDDAIVCIPDGAVELYYDEAKVFYTTTAGAIVKRPSGGATEFSIYGCEGNNAELRLISDDGDDNDDFYKLVAKTNHDFAIENFRNGSSWETNLTCTGDGAVDLYHNGTKKFYTDSGGATVAGNLTMASAGDGINFGADSHATGATSELLDDYEEGSWTPNLSTTASTTSHTQSVQFGAYTKIGNMVFCEFAVTWTNYSGSGNLMLRGLPFTAKNDSNWTACVNISTVTNFGYGGSDQVGIVEANSTNIYWKYHDSNGSHQISVGATQTSGQVIGSFHYYT
jgi:hypothetical protein